MGTELARPAAAVEDILGISIRAKLGFVRETWNEQ
jgi:hypothetical protein